MSRIRRQIAVEKLPAVIEHLEAALESQGKIIVFGHHREVVLRISEHFGSEAVHIIGDTSPKQRQEAVDRFQEDPTCRLFVGNMRAAGVGLTLTAASTVIFAELDWVPAVVLQAEDRAHRLGQIYSVLVQHLVFDGSIDSQIAKALVYKLGIANRALDDPSHLNFEVPVLPKMEVPKPKKKFPEASQRERLAAREVLGALFDHNVLKGLGKALLKKLGRSLPNDSEVWMIKRMAKSNLEVVPRDEHRVLDLG